MIESAAGPLSERSGLMIYCCGCAADVSARLTDGREIYPHRPDLARQPFWRCDACGNFVGCHHKTATPTKPLGVIPTPALREARKQIHAILDPLWQVHGMRRRHLYAQLSKAIGRSYHTAELRSSEEAAIVLQCLSGMRQEGL